MYKNISGELVIAQTESSKLQNAPCHYKYNYSSLFLYYLSKLIFLRHQTTQSRIFQAFTILIQSKNNLQNINQIGNQ